ncbi:MAG: hypothetical protein MO853_12260 [Candidatus Protistobacter heckmanni]|nr:hypothetical protein [Candidatus Protistobacter heckmanni]
MLGHVLQAALIDVDDDDVGRRLLDEEQRLDKQVENFYFSEANYPGIFQIDQRECRTQYRQDNIDINTAARQLSLKTGIDSLQYTMNHTFPDSIAVEAKLILRRSLGISIFLGFFVGLLFGYELLRLLPGNIELISILIFNVLFGKFASISVGIIIALTMVVSHRFLMVTHAEPPGSGPRGCATACSR